jgi:hypothetical protein
MSIPEIEGHQLVKEMDVQFQPYQMLVVPEMILDQVVCQMLEVPANQLNLVAQTIHHHARQMSFQPTTLH